LTAIEYWMKELANRSVSTREKYKSFMVRFCEWQGKTPDQLVEQRKVDLRSTDPKEQRSVESALKGFISYLEEGENSVSTQQVAYAAVRSFFEMNYQPLRMRRGDYPTGESIGSRVATKDDVKKLLEDASLRIKAMILLLKDTGLRVSDIVRLRYGNLAKGLEDDQEFISLSLITKKNRIAAKTFVGPEAVDALKEYAEERRKGTRRIPPEKMGTDSPLFRTRTPEVRPLTRSGMSSTITYHAGRIGVDGQFSAHSFRKFFQTQLEAAGVHPNWIDQMMGHRLINSRDSYSLPTDQQLKEAYKKAYSQLRVYGRPDVEARISNLEAELEERNQIIEALVTNGSDKKTEIESLKRRIQELERERNESKLTESQVSELLRRIEKLEKQARKA
jgi:site-specific recombinase XerD